MSLTLGESFRVITKERLTKKKTQLNALLFLSLLFLLLAVVTLEVCLASEVLHVSLTISEKLHIKKCLNIPLGSILIWLSRTE